MEVMYKTLLTIWESQMDVYERRYGNIIGEIGSYMENSGISAIDNSCLHLQRLFEEANEYKHKMDVLRSVISELKGCRKVLMEDADSIR